MQQRAKAVERLRQLALQPKAEVPGVNVGITGEPVLEYDEMQQSQKDSTVATVVSLVLCALIFIYGYRETGRPIKATICLIVGLGYTMGFTTLTVGHLNILTVTFLPMLIGLAIDFGVHLITRVTKRNCATGKIGRGSPRAGHGQYRPGHLHRVLHDGWSLFCDGVDRFQRASRKWGSSPAVAC